MYWNLVRAAAHEADRLLNSNIRCIEIDLNSGLTGQFEKLNSNIRCIEISEPGRKR